MKRNVIVLAVCLAVSACGPRAPDPVGPPEPTGAIVAAEIVPETCLPEGHDRERLDALKTAAFVIADEAGRQAFAKAIVACLGSADPGLRDGVAYEALSTLLRGKLLSADTMKAIKDDLLARLDAVDPAGVEAPFAALALSEVARADRIEPFLSDDDLLKLVVEAQDYLLNVQDYRGFEEGVGWRHGVAHGSDLLMQLALNPRVGREEAEVMRSSIGVQVTPKAHFYIYGEPERLARPILYMAQRGWFTENEWVDWLALTCGPGPSGSWEGIYASQEGLARRHNAWAFLSALYVNVTLNDDAEDDVLLAGIDLALRAMP